MTRDDDWKLQETLLTAKVAQLLKSQAEIVDNFPCALLWINMTVLFDLICSILFVVSILSCAAESPPAETRPTASFRGVSSEKDESVRRLQIDACPLYRCRWSNTRFKQCLKNKCRAFGSKPVVNGKYTFTSTKDSPERQILFRHRYCWYLHTRPHRSSRDAERVARWKLYIRTSRTLLLWY